MLFLLWVLRGGGLWGGGGGGGGGGSIGMQVQQQLCVASGEMFLPLTTRHRLLARLALVQDSTAHPSGKSYSVPLHHQALL